MQTMYDQTYQPLTLNSYFDKIFYINLARDTERNKNMVAQFARFGITNYERVAATELTELPDVVEYRNFNKRDQKYLIGQLSCRATHINCMRVARQRGYQKVLILEDDVVFTEDPNQLLTINHELQRDWDMLYFGGLVEPFFRNQVVCAHAYGVKHTLFDDIIHMGAHSGMEIDNFYAKVLQHMSYNYNQSGKYNIRLIQPFNLVVQDKLFPSNIQ